MKKNSSKKKASEIWEESPKQRRESAGKAVAARKYPKEWGKVFIPKGFQVMKKVDSREVKCLKSLLRKLRTYTDKTEKPGANIWNAGVAICIGEVKTRIEKEKKITHYAPGK